MAFKKKLDYHFDYKDSCNMCSAPIKESKTLGIRLNTSQGLRPKKVYGIGVSVMQCQSCGLIYSNPQPIPSDINDHYGIEPSDYWVEDYFSGSQHQMDYHLGILKKFMDIKPNMRALDIGTGIGFSMLEMEKMGFETYGIEPSAQFLKFAQEKNGIKAERLTLGMVEDAQYPKDYFDFILIRVVLEHLYDPAGCIEKALSWLKPNGIIHIEVPSSNHLIAKLINLYYRLVGTNYVTNLSPLHAPYHLHEFSAKAFEKHGQKANYEVVLAEYYPADVFFFPRFLHPVFDFAMRKTNTGMQLAVWLRKK